MHNKKFIKTGIAVYTIGVAGMALQQFYYGDFRPVFLPETWPAWMHQNIFSYLFAAILLATSVMIIINKKRFIAGLVQAILFFMFFLFFHAPFLLFFNIYSPLHLGLWTNPFKELAFCGSALIVATVLINNDNAVALPSYKLSQRLYFIGVFFFCFMLTCFGVDHFLYPDFVSSLVPSWIPGKLFWTYFAGVVLAGAGITIFFKIQTKTVALLTALMLFLWLILLHIPRAITAPATDNGNELTSVFQAFAFSGIALIIAYSKQTETETNLFKFVNTCFVRL